MGAKEYLHQWVDSLTDSDAEVVRRFADNQRLSEVDDEPLSRADIAGIRRGEADVRAGRMKTLDAYKRERGL